MTTIRERIDDVRVRLFARAVLADTVVVAIVVGACALLFAIAIPWMPRWPWAFALVLGPILGVVRAKRARPSDEDVVSYLDRRIGAEEVIVTAWDVKDDPPPLLRSTVARAEAMIREAEKSTLMPSLHAAQLAWLGPAIVFAAIAQIVPVPSRANVGEDRDHVTIR